MDVEKQELSTSTKSANEVRYEWESDRKQALNTVCHIKHRLLLIIVNCTSVEGLLLIHKVHCFPVVYS